jgi:hypothetical protein
MRTLNGLSLVAFLIALPLAGHVAAGESAGIRKADLGERFLLQTSYSEVDGSLQSFATSRSRVVKFERHGATVRMLDDTGLAGSDAEGEPLLAEIPIRGETEQRLDLDFNAGFRSVNLEEDRTGEDYYGRVDKRNGRAFQLFRRKAVSLSCEGSSLVFEQEAMKHDGDRVQVHYYLSPYRPDPAFLPFEMTSLKHFGFYETYPQRRSGRWVLYAMKFGADAPIVFALSSSIPERYRDAVRDGVLYWNRALGRPLLQVIDAPANVEAPRADYNVIQWITSGNYSSTSYIQGDPLTGQILHAHVFVLRETMMDGDLELQNDHLRYIVAHEIGHALGMRHNFASTRPTTVMDYFDVDEILRIGRDIREGQRALPYDRAVIRHVYLGEPLDVDALPPFCTDGQKGCSPFPSKPPLEPVGIKGNWDRHETVPPQ